MSPLPLRGKAAPTIDHLLDHTMRVWRPQERLGEARETIRDYGGAPVYSDVKCTVTRKRGAIAPEHGGETTFATRMLYAPAGITLQENDLCELVTGPEAPATLKVQTPSKPSGHHLETPVTEYHGKVPTPGS